MRNPVSREAEQAEVDVQRIHVDGLDRRWPGRHCVKISDGQIAERIAFEAEIHLQVLFRGVPNREVADCGQQNWPMKNDQESHAYREANHHPPPNAPLTPAFRLIVIGHKTILLPLRLGGKGKWGAAPMRLRYSGIA
jgi:hypothetical protein